MTFNLASDITEIVDGLESIRHHFAGKRILITGGRGFLGRYFSDVLLELNKKQEPCSVIVVDNHITSGELGRQLEEDPNFRFIEHDVIKPLEIEEKIDFIFHAAGIASPHYYRKFPLETLDVATTGLRNSLELARKHQAKISFFSSSEIYGDPDPQNIPTKETYKGNVSSTGPRSMYDESKRLGETLVMIYHRQFGVHGTVIRPHNVFGPGMQKTDYRVLPNFAAKILNGEPVQVYGDGKQTRTFCYITDAIQGFFRILALGGPGEVYNIGTPGPEITMPQLLKEINSVTDLKVDYEIIPYPDSYPADEPHRRCPDLTKSRNELDYESKIDLGTGLSRFFRWAKIHY